MKKLFLVGVGFILAVAIFGIAGLVYAQTQEPPETQTTDGTASADTYGGWGRGSHGFGPMGFGLDEDEAGLLHDYLWPAIAEAFDLTDEQIKAFEIARDTVQNVREDLTQEEIRAAMQQAMSTAIENALADGAITEEQAERWLERVEQIGDRLPGVMWDGPGMMGQGGDGVRDVVRGYRRGFISGIRLSRQMMVNHEYLDAAIAETLDISIAELQEMKADQGFNLKDYAEDQGLSEDEFTALRVEIFTKAILAALEDGAITQEQADWMLERLENIGDRGSWFDQP